jgi:hypothetical protein
MTGFMPAVSPIANACAMDTQGREVLMCSKGMPLSVDSARQPIRQKLISVRRREDVDLGVISVVSANNKC